MIKRIAAVITAVFIVFAPSAALAEDDPLNLCPLELPPPLHRYTWNCGED